MTEQDTSVTPTEPGGRELPYNHLEIIQSLGISEEAAEELAKELQDPLGLIKDHTYGGYWFIVRWHDEVSDE